MRFAQRERCRTQGIEGGKRGTGTSGLQNLREKITARDRPFVFSSVPLERVKKSKNLFPRHKFLIQKLLHRREKLHAIFFHDDGVGAFADLNVALIRRAGEFVEGTHTVIMEKNRMQLFTAVQQFLDEKFMAGK